MPVLSDILRDIHAKASVYFCDRLTPPWKLEMKELDQSSFHQVRRGQCFVECEGQKELAGPGDVIFIPKGSDHILSSVDSDAQKGGKEFPTMLLCGYFQFDQVLEHPLLATLPPLLILRSETLEKNPGLKQSLNFLTEEFTSNLPGSKLLLDKLTEVMFIQLIRTQFVQNDQPNFSRALFDDKISRALRLMHNDVAFGWTLDNLSKAIGFSRTAFANRFRELVGTTMFEYLTNIRMQKACNLLTTTTLPVYLIAEKSGYRSEVSFNKAFKTHLATTPNKYRKQRLTGD